jgi:glutathione S-transferase
MLDSCDSAAYPSDEVGTTDGTERCTSEVPCDHPRHVQPLTVRLGSQRNRESVMAKPHLVSFNLCPYVQRAATTLQFKNVPYDITYIDLDNKPGWFLEMSPMGKVPVLREGKTTLFESGVIAEYLDEVHQPQLHPTDALEKARHRAWMSYVSAIGVFAHTLMTTDDEAVAQRTVDAANDKLAHIEEQLIGPFFGGDSFQLIDACSAGFLQRLLWTDARAPQLGLFKNTPKTRAWAETLNAHAAVKAALKEDIQDIFDAYLASHGAWLGAQAV